MAAANEHTSQLTLPSDTEVVIRRVLKAPPALVWKAWTDPKHLPRWWGPAGFSTTTRAIDVRPGGSWRFVMHGPDGHDYENHITYLEVIEPTRLVYKHGGDKDCEPVNFETTVTFEASGADGRHTTITLQSVFPSRAARDFVLREYNAGEGGKQTLARLDEYVAGMSVGNDQADRPFVITRVFDAPRELVWSAWTRQENLARWFGPKGVTIPHCRLDLRVGGVFHYCMRSPDGSEHWGRWVFREIVPPERLVFVVSFADASGNAVRAFFDESWPLEMLSTVTIAEHAGKGGGTVVTVKWEALNAGAGERQRFDAGHDSMRQGWTGTMEQLQEYLRQAVP